MELRKETLLSAYMFGWGPPVSTNRSGIFLWGDLPGGSKLERIWYLDTRSGLFEAFPQGKKDSFRKSFSGWREVSFPSKRSIQFTGHSKRDGQLSKKKNAARRAPS